MKKNKTLWFLRSFLMYDKYFGPNLEKKYMTYYPHPSQVTWLLALTVDSPANKTNAIDPNHIFSKDMERISSMTSSPDLSRCMLYGSGPLSFY